jgi:cyclin G-associated kinase
MCRHTTPMYRPPEILDTYLHLPINVSMDIWAFGCLLYVLKFGRHPFEDSAKLRIINCNYSIPPGSNESDPIVQIIKYSNSSSNRVLIDLFVLTHI